MLIYLLILISSHSSSQQTIGRCTYHDYEGDQQRFGINTYDLSPPWCGGQYSHRNLAKVMAMNGISSPNCNTCWNVTGLSPDGQSIFIQAIDYKADPGLDIALTSFKLLFPQQNPLDPQQCSWIQVDNSYCEGICLGSSQECSNSQNTLPIPINIPLSTTTNIPPSTTTNIPLSTTTNIPLSTTTNIPLSTTTISDTQSIIPISTHTTDTFTCEPDGIFQCANDGFYTCVYSHWVFRYCPPTLICKQSSPFHIFCDYN